MFPFAIFGLGPIELSLIIALILALFAPSLIPKIAKRLGQSIASIRRLTDSSKEKSSDNNKRK
ncbi:MAG: twin-arginine translocase TatA/TatE family subunit [Actinomycetota bacterium]|nr:twin-arginine translocase TatA/TatE family subunit [Actinomycetota bacterium]